MSLQLQPISVLGILKRGHGTLQRPLHRAIHTPSVSRYSLRTSKYSTFTAFAVGSIFFGYAVYSSTSPSTVSAEPQISTSQGTAASKPLSPAPSLLNGPQVFLWGDNSCKVTNPGSKSKLTKTPTRLPFFDNVYLRDLKLGTGFGAAIDENGALVMWGKAFADSDPGVPVKVFEGGDLASLAVSKDRVFALSSDGRVFSLPVSQAEQLAKRPSTTQPSTSSAATVSSWLWFWKRAPSLPDLNFRLVAPENLLRGEKIVSVSAGLYHLLMLTNRGRVFSSVASTEDYPSQGQMGIAGLRWETRPAGPLDQCMEIQNPKGSFVTDIATGDFHSLIRDQAGKAYAFGDNSFGQLGLESGDPLKSPIAIPTLVDFDDHYRMAKRAARVTAIAAGGLNSFFTIESTSVIDPTDPNSKALAQRYNHHSIDLWACGNGITGSLGTNRWTHVQSPPCLVPALSGLFEFSEKTRKFFPLPITSLSVGATHVAAVVDTTDTSAVAQPHGILGRSLASLPTGTSSNSSGNSSGGTSNSTAARASLPPTLADLMVFGGNEFWQLGTGKRANVPVPSFIPPLERAEGEVWDPNQSERRMVLPLRQRAKVKGKERQVEQRVVAGRGMTGVYWAVVE